MLDWWEQLPVVDALRLSPDECFTLLTQLSATSDKRRGADQRRHGRTRFWRNDAIVRLHRPEAGHTAYAVKTYNISPSGISFLHGFFVQTCVRCDIALKTLSRRRVGLSGRVVRCRHLRGRTHEIGVRFDTLIDMGEFVRGRATDAVGCDGSGQRPPQFNGRILYVDDCTDDQELVTFVAEELGASCRTAATLDDALHSAETTALDIVMVRLHLRPGGAAELARRLRSQGYGGAIIALTGSMDMPTQADADREAEALAAGCDCVLSAPITVERLGEVFDGFLPRRTVEGYDAEGADSLRRSSARMRPLIQSFVNRLETRITELQQLLAAANFDSLHHVARQLAGSAESYSRPQIARAMRELAAMAHRRARPDQIKDKISELVALCAAARWSCD